MNILKDLSLKLEYKEQLLSPLILSCKMPKNQKNTLPLPFPINPKNYTSSLDLINISYYIRRALEELRVTSRHALISSWQLCGLH